MVGTGQLEKNEIHGGLGEVGHSSVARNVHVGDLVELLVDGRFFKRSDGKDERYSGYVASIDDFSITLSPTPEDNLRHGYVALQPEQKRVSTHIETFHVRKYRIL